MHIKSIELTNFKKHASKVVNFDAGSNMIVGNNYAGKSTIEQAILVCLFGNSMAPGVTNGLIRHGSSDFKLRLELSNGVVVTRSSRDSTIARGEADPFARGHTAVNNAVAELLSLDKNSFTKAFTSEQGTPQQLLQMEGAELQRFIESSIGIERLDQIVKEANRNVLTLQAGAKAYADQVLSPEDFQAKGTEMQMYLNTLSDLEGQVDELARQRAELREREELLRVELVNGLRHNAEIAAYESKEKQLEGLVVHPELDISAQISEASELTKAITLKGQVDQLHRRRMVLDQDLANCGVPQLVGEKQDIQFCNDAYQKISSGVKVALAEQVRLTKAIEGSSCPTCKRPYDLGGACLDELKQELEDNQTLVGKLRTEQDTCGRALKTIEIENAAIDRVIRANESLELNRKNIEAGLASIDEQLSELPDLTGSDEWEGKLKDLNEFIRNQTKANADIAATNRLIDKIQSELAKMIRPEGEPVDTKTIQDELNDVSNRDRSKTTKQQELLGAVTLHQVHIANINKELEAHTKASEKFSEYGNRAKLYKSVSDHLSNSRTRIISDALDVMFSVASEFVSMCTDGDVQEVLVNEGAISYRENGVVFSKFNASGAQKTLMGLGMKLGLIKLVRSNFDALLLDEVSADMSEEVSMRCMLALDNYCTQVISVSHRPMDIAGNVINL